MIYIILSIIVISVIYVILTYNKLVRYRMNVRETDAQIQVELKRGFDLLPNIIETVKGYAAHESETLKNITKYRTGDTQTQLNGSRELGLAIHAVAESYPELKADTNFRQLMQTLEDTENRLSTSRHMHNTNVADYNELLQLFPTNIIASMLNFKAETMLVTPEDEKQNVQVKF